MSNVLPLSVVIFFGDVPALIAQKVVAGICDDLEGLGFAVCSAGSLAGTFLGWVIVAWAWLVGFLFLTVIWFARRPPRRLCPPYGHPVDMGAAACRVCGYEFRAGD